MNRFYDKKLLKRCLLVFLGTLVVMRLTTGVGFIVLLPVVMAALTRNQPEKFLFYMLLMISMVVTNPVFAPRGSTFFMEQRAMFTFLGFILTVKVAGQRTSPIVKPFALMIAYVLYMVIPSVDGWMPVISLLKLFLFGVIYFAFYSTANMAASNGRSGLVPIRTVILSIAIPFILGSVLVIPFPALGMMSWEELQYASAGASLFRGFTNHSQCLGPVTACLFTLLFADFLFGIRKPDKLYLALLVCCPILVFKTGSRTALGTLFAGVSFALYFFMRARGIRQQWKSKVFSAMMLCVVLGSAVLALSGAGEGFKRFLVKRDVGEGPVTVSAESILSSRMGLADSAIANFKEKPLIGNGFQVNRALADRRVSHWTQLLSAPVEKGVWVTAILEEGGATGFLVFLVFLVSAFSALIRHRAYTGASTLFVFVVMNLGEFTMFSMSYAGGFCWALVFAALVLDAARMREARNLQYGLSPYGLNHRIGR